MKAFLLAAGLGTRLRPITFFAPKPLALVGGKPIIDYAIGWLKRNGVGEIYVIGYYMQGLLSSYLAERHPDVVFIPSRALLGTAGQLYYARDYVADGEDVIVAPGDVVTDMRLSGLIKSHVESGARLTIAAREVEAGLRFGVLEAEGGRLTRWREKPRQKYMVSTGIYVVDGGEVKRLKEEYLDFNDFATSLIPHVFVYLVNAEIFDVGTLEDLNKASSIIAERKDLWA
ncbi:MAG: NDP-sugar synthase [Thermoproteus sp. AZ2]|jgi:NDP-sugar pyrophosphorylase family protein|uniref:NDP-sugar synthase n=1 Tax=Thermoproteus sp. AZ2 TaxID=1609232 RepID=A0ACC6V270_9CREN|nr:MAG: sugar-phosphate nucleotidyltransferase [Thermoproteus sp. AZ2]